ncbi:hypothetical protein EYZ11_012946 [Aspergillus tanneri]|uniref:Pyridoxamine 5'-phosphate oxidase Alr4036 family FMN-binding domain-containing protein n=1 Tax=Aspergillus tanneri TaxID=1220188 RepID=A0A4S3IYX5_9EURO|nr:hypothetical protein EYZ11_012946 [Aspergillus tanneri]
MTQQQAQRQAPAPWRTLFSTHLSQNSTTSFTLSTVAYDAANRPVPRSRTCEFRGFFPNPALHPTALEALNTQADGPNPAFYESDYLSLTTDVRMDKTHQIGESGGLVEGVFWLADVRQQWRIKGVAFVVGDPDGGELENNSRNEILKGMRCGELGQEGKEEDGKRWSWDRLVTSYFANHSPVMRGLSVRQIQI